MHFSVSTVLATTALFAAAHAGMTLTVWSEAGCKGTSKTIEVNQNSCNPHLPTSLSYKVVRYTDAGKFMFWSDGDGAGCVGQLRGEGCCTCSVDPCGCTGNANPGTCYDMSGPAKAVYVIGENPSCS